MEEYARDNQVPYINFLDLQEEAGLDFAADTYDGGLHLNLSGAEKLSRYFGKILQQEYGLEDHRQEVELAAIWQEKTEFYHQMQAQQEQELQEYGYIRKFSEEEE